MAQKTAQERRVLAALRRLEPTIGDAFKDALEKAAGNVDFVALEKAIRSRDIGAAVDLLRIDPRVLFPVDEALRSGFMAGGSLIAADLPAGLSGVFSFDGRHDRAIEWVNKNAGDLIQGIVDESREAVRRIIAEGINSGQSSTSLARQITGKKVGSRRVGGVLGLTSEQTDSVIRARRILSDPDLIRKYFIRDRETGKFRPRYSLSDRRFDRQIKAAIRDGRAIKGALLDQIVAAHQSKALGYRGRVIAKDQSFRAIEAGRAEAYQQAAENPNVETVTVRWQHNLSQNPRDDHVEMDGTVITLGEYFIFEDAMMKHPHDPAGGAEHNIGCRCIGIYRVRLRR